MTMAMSPSLSRLYFRTATAIAALMLLAGPVLAAECPADKTGTDLMQPGATENSGVTDTVIGMIDLSQEKVAIPRHLRLRRLEIQPGGTVAWHSHGERPAIITILAGSITEYSSACAVPLEHKAGDVSVEKGGLAHWWKNNGTETVVLLATDVFDDPNDHQM